MASSKVFYGVVVTLVCTAAISTVTFPRDAQSGSVLPGTLSAADLASLYGRGEGEGCVELTADACSKTRDEHTCYQWNYLEDLGRAKKTGKTYSDVPTSICGEPDPPNAKVESWLEVDCYKITEFVESWGMYGLMCVTGDPVWGDYCDFAPEQIACGYCWPADTPAEWKKGKTCACLDP